MHGDLPAVRLASRDVVKPLAPDAPAALVGKCRPYAKHAECDHYAGQAVEHFNMTSRRGCGVRPDGRWNANRYAHYQWCLDASKTARASEEEARNR